MAFTRSRDGEVTEVGRVAVVNGKTQFLGFEKAKVLGAHLQGGVTVGDRLFTPDEGVPFLRALLRVYRGDYLRADEIIG